MVDLNMVNNESPGSLIPVHGTDPRQGSWEHRAFRPDPLGSTSPALSSRTYRTVGDARAALAGLDSTARRLPNPRLLRNPTLRVEAQSTSALEGTYAPLADVLAADVDAPSNLNLREVLNYVQMAGHAYAWVGEGRPLSVSLLCDLQGILMRGTPLEAISGRVRDRLVVIGRRRGVQVDELPVHASRFVPAPPGPELEVGLQSLVDWLRLDHRKEIDPVVAAAMGHYQFETLHPFNDGNGRLGRLLTVVQFFAAKVLSEPTLTVSPWFETRREEYYDSLLAVSTCGDWDTFVAFFAEGVAASAETTHSQMLTLVAVQAELKETVRASRLRADNALVLVDFAVANPSFTVRQVQAELHLSYARANGLVAQLVELEVLAPRESPAQERRFFAPEVVAVLTRRDPA